MLVSYLLPRKLVCYCLNGSRSLILVLDDVLHCALVETKKFRILRFCLFRVKLLLFVNHKQQVFVSHEFELELVPDKTAHLTMSLFGRCL